MRMMLQKLATHIWPKDQPGLRFRVVVAVSLLIGAKVTASYTNTGYTVFNFICGQ